MTTDNNAPADDVVARLRARQTSEDEGGNEAALERAMMGMEARAALWAERVNLTGMIANLVHVNRLSPAAPQDVRDKFIKRQAEQFYALCEQSYLEGCLEGGLSRKAYDADLDAKAAAEIERLRAKLEETNVIGRALFTGSRVEKDMCRICELEDGLRELADEFDGTLTSAERMVERARALIERNSK